MRPLRALLAIVFLVVGLVLGVLNAAPATVDLGVFEVSAGLGVILLCTLLIGVLLGGLAIVVSVVLPLRRQLRSRVAPAEISAAMPVESSLSTPAEP
jgi:lipopolysaccharide assembly protein A